MKIYTRLREAHDAETITAVIRQGRPRMNQPHRAIRDTQEAEGHRNKPLPSSTMTSPNKTNCRRRTRVCFTVTGTVTSPLRREGTRSTQGHTDRQKTPKYNKQSQLFDTPPGIIYTSVLVAQVYRRTRNHSGEHTMGKVNATMILSRTEINTPHPTNTAWQRSPPFAVDNQTPHLPSCLQHVNTHRAHDSAPTGFPNSRDQPHLF